MLGEAIWSLKCQYRSAEVAKKGNFSSFLDFSQKTNERICSNCTQMFVFPCPIYWRDRIGCLISPGVSPKKNSQCGRHNWMAPKVENFFLSKRTHTRGRSFLSFHGTALLRLPPSPVFGVICLYLAVMAEFENALRPSLHATRPRPTVQRVKSWGISYI